MSDGEVGCLIVGLVALFVGVFVSAWVVVDYFIPTAPLHIKIIVSVFVVGACTPSIGSRS